ncbi:MAG: hypothetical protein Q4G23_04480, partial [Clostridia bacterium]|nr:hypothetical protein [Clostridia bacterium]
TPVTTPEDVPEVTTPATPETTPEVVPEVTPEATPAAPAPVTPPVAESAPTPDFLFPSSVDPAAPTGISYDFCEIRFKDTGADTYTLYYRRAATPGANAAFNDANAGAITVTVGEGLVARNTDGTMSLFIPDGLEEGYLYRFFISDENGVSCSLSTYAFAESY